MTDSAAAVPAQLEMVVPDWEVVDLGPGGAWALKHGDVVVASSGSQKRTQRDAIVMMRGDLWDALLEVQRLTRELQQERAACAALSAWADQIKGRTDPAQEEVR